MTITRDEAELALKCQRQAVINRQAGRIEAARQLEALARHLLKIGNATQSLSEASAGIQSAAQK